MNKQFDKPCLACPKCQDILHYDDSDSCFSCRSCSLNYPKHCVNGFHIIDFVSQDQDFTKGFSIAEDNAKYKKLLEVFDNHDFYSFLKVYEDISSHKYTNISDKKILAYRQISQYDLGHGKDSLLKAEEMCNYSLKKINYNGIALENGCGHGYFTYEFAKRFQYLYVADCSISYLILAIKFLSHCQHNFGNSELHKKISLIRCNSEKLPMQENTINFIHSNQVIEHVGNQEKFLFEMNRVSSIESGLTYIVSPNRFSALPEPHYGMRFFGFYPKFIADFLIKHQNRTSDAVKPLGILKLIKIIKRDFKNNYLAVGVMPNLKVANPTKLKNITRIITKNKYISYIFNKLLIFILPTHYVLAWKEPNLK